MVDLTQFLFTYDSKDIDKSKKLVKHSSFEEVGPSRAPLCLFTLVVGRILLHV